MFTGQRLDSSGLYYYGARYYDPAIGRFISADTIVQDYNNPQSLNRYTYVLNNPLKYTDPTGHWFDLVVEVFSIGFDIQQMVSDPSLGNAGYLALDVALAFVPLVPGVAGVSAKGVSHSGDALKVIKDFTSNVDNIKSAIRLGIKNPWSFRGKLQMLTGMSDEMVKGKEAHHILPVKFEQYFKSTWKKENLDFDINNPAWGKWVDQQQHKLFSKSYNDDWKAWIKEHKNTSVEEVLQHARKVYDYIK